MAEDRYLICVPLGGLNDNFCQIEKCWAYAERWNRKLYIHSIYSSLSDNMWELFEEQPTEVENASSIILYNTDGAFWRPRGSTVRPATLAQSAVTDSELVRDANAEHGSFAAFVNALSRKRLSLDFKSDHPEDILVHSSWGGGDASFSLVNRLRVRAPVRDEILSRLTHLPQDYVSLHIRCTDLQSDYKTFLRTQNDRLVGRNVLVCSDSQKVIDFAKRCLSASKVHTTASRRSTDNVPLHNKLTGNKFKNKSAATLDALTDLVALARGEEIEVAPTYKEVKGPWKHHVKRYVKRALRIEKPTQRSGFSNLAEYLCSEKDVLNRFFNP